MIGKLEDLSNAARGSFKKRDVFGTTGAPAQQTPSGYAAGKLGRATYSPTVSNVTQNAAYVDALTRAGGGTASNLADSYVAASRENPTALYGSILGGVNRSMGGLSAKGKYGGFNTSADLQAAIEGSAINLRQQTVPQLRTEATNLYNQLDPMRQTAMQKATGLTTSEFDPQSGGAAQFRLMESMAPERMGAVVRNQYMTKLGDWYKKQSAPAEEYLKTAQQLETTPLSQLAQSVATKAFGMNPDLAAGKFQGLDASYWKTARDQKYVSQYGMPYDEYQATQKDLKTATSGLANSSLEAATGFAAKSLAGVTGMTAAQLNNQLNVTAEFTDPDTQSTVSGTGSQIIESMKTYISGGESDKAQKIMDEVSSTPGAQGLAALLKAYYHMAVVQPTKYDYQNALYLSP